MYIFMFILMFNNCSSLTLAFRFSIEILLARQHEMTEEGLNKKDTLILNEALNAPDVATTVQLQF